MKKRNLALLLALLSVLPIVSPAATPPKLERGEDFIETPALGSGLFMPNLFQSDMVLQRDKPIRIWGWAEPGETVTVSFGGQTQTAKASQDRSWKITFSAMPANTTPQEMVVKGKDKTLTLKNILIGDLWVLGGQSNMEFQTPKVDNGDLEVVSANFSNIRLLNVPQQNGPDAKTSFPRWYQWSDFFSTHNRQGYWEVCSPETVRTMSAIGYVFARRIHMATQVPIGLVNVSRGGTCLETWTPMEVLKSIHTPEVTAKLAEWDKKVAEFNPQKDLEERVMKFNQRTEKMKATGQDVSGRPPNDLLPGPALDMNRPGNCYASTIVPLVGLSVKGAIWHQGYNNALDPNGHVLYQQVFTPMIKAWRTAFSDPEMPFGIISQETDGEPQDLDNFLEKMPDEGTYIREAHYKTFLDLRKAGDKNIGFASSFDQRRSWYHPQIKIPVGERMARWALATQYGMKQIRWLPPTIKEMQVESGRILLTLDDDTAPYNDGPIMGFAIAGKDGKFQPATARFLEKGKDARNRPQSDKRVITLTSPLVPEPIHYRYAWCRNPLGNLKSTDHTDIPMETQRSDDWSIAGMYENQTGKKPAVPGVLNRNEHNELSAALRRADLERRIANAQALLKEVSQK
jgi:sialate O-acetylesterase